MVRFRTILLTAAIALIATVASYSQSNVILYTEPGFDPWGFTSKLTEALKDSPIGSRIKTAKQPELERLDAAKVGDLVVSLIQTDFRCEGKTIYAVTLVFYEIGRDKVNSVQKIFLASTAGVIREVVVDQDVQQYKKMIVDAVNSR
ncbi:MAG: hypothetical protein JNL32_04630 [Candidatus Kapabacteria bacterium]|nr:hypothetical protein [Candidatus Kapabacteria bacterium]